MQCLSAWLPATCLLVPLCLFACLNSYLSMLMCLHSLSLFVRLSVCPCICLCVCLPVPSASQVLCEIAVIHITRIYFSHLLIAHQVHGVKPTKVTLEELLLCTHELLLLNTHELWLVSNCESLLILSTRACAD